MSEVRGRDRLYGGVAYQPEVAEAPTNCPTLYSVVPVERGTASMAVAKSAGRGHLVRIDWGSVSNGYTSDRFAARRLVIASAQQRDKFYLHSEVHDLAMTRSIAKCRVRRLVELARKSYERLGLEFRWLIVDTASGGSFTRRCT